MSQMILQGLLIFFLIDVSFHHYRSSRICCYCSVSRPPCFTWSWCMCSLTGVWCSPNLSFSLTANKLRFCPIRPRNLLSFERGVSLRALGEFQGIFHVNFFNSSSSAPLPYSFTWWRTQAAFAVSVHHLPSEPSKPCVLFWVLVGDGGLPHQSSCCPDTQLVITVSSS